MSDHVIRTEKHLTIVEAHPYHRYVSDGRPRGNAIVERAYDAASDHADVSAGAKR